jgi:hypothetical protein
VSDELAQYLELSFASPVIHPFQRRKFNKAVKNLDALDAELQEMLERLGNLSFSQFIKQVVLV